MMTVQPYLALTEALHGAVSLEHLTALSPFSSSFFASFQPPDSARYQYMVSTPRDEALSPGVTSLFGLLRLLRRPYDGGYRLNSVHPHVLTNP
jgi:hypothetical protein